MINLVDLLIFVVILMAGILGFKRGVFKEFIKFIGVILVFYLAYKLKNIIGDFLVINFPFMDFPNFLRGATSLNIVMYQSLAFIVTAVVLFLVYDFLVSITGIFEKLLRLTIILGIPSKILGFFIGLVEGYVIAYVLVFFIAQPALNFDMAKESEYAEKMLKNTPVLTSVTKDTLEFADKIMSVSKTENVNELNLKIIDLVLENKVTSVEVIEKVVEKGKLNVKGIDKVIIKYKEVQ